MAGRLLPDRVRSGVPAKTLELMNLRASQINGCGVCVAQHPYIARKLGETDDRIFGVAAWRESPYFSEAERAAFALTEAATRLSDRAEPVPVNGLGQYRHDPLGRTNVTDMTNKAD